MDSVTNCQAPKGQAVIKPKNSRLVFIDFIKCLSIILIMINHMPLGDALRDKIMVGFNVDMGVPFFMIVSGFTYTMSMERKGITSMEQWFEKKNFSGKINRIVPFFVIGEGILFIWTMILCLVGHYEFKERLIEFVTHGAYGPGSYYFWILIQIAFVFPIMIKLLKKDYFWGSVAILGFNLVFEIFAVKSSMDVELYRMLMFRYTAFIWAGITLYYYKEKIRIRHILAPFAVGFAYIWALRFTDFDPSIIAHWEDTSFFIVGYSFMFVYLAMKFFEKFQPGPKLTAALKTMGNATYHIYVFQMVYFYMRFGRLADGLFGIFTGTVVSVLVCSAIGIWCCDNESKIMALLRSSSKKVNDGIQNKSQEYKEYKESKDYSMTKNRP